MGLRIRIKPEGRLFVNGSGWIKNVGNRPMEVLCDSSLMIEREKRVDRIIGKEDGKEAGKDDDRG